MRRLTVLMGASLVAWLGASGCHGPGLATDDVPAASARDDASPRAEASREADGEANGEANGEAARSEGIDPRDQYALAHAIEAARSQTENLEGALARTRAAWIGRRYRWEVAFVPALCGAAGACVVMPFDHRRDPDRPIRQGWLPRLELSDDARAAVADECAAHRRCVIEVQADLEQFELSTEQPTSLTLSNVEIRRARAADSAESWVLGTRRPLAGRRLPAVAAPSETRQRAAVADSLG